MAIFKPLPQCMISDIDLFLERNRGTCISVYSEAEKIRRKWEEQNIALEDVVSALVERCGQHGVAVSFDQTDGADTPEVLLEDHGDEAPARRCN